MKLNKILERKVTQKAYTFILTAQIGSSKKIAMSRKAYAAFRSWVSSNSLTETTEYHFIAKSKDADRGELIIIKKQNDENNI